MRLIFCFAKDIFDGLMSCNSHATCFELCLQHPYQRTNAPDEIIFFVIV